MNGQITSLVNNWMGDHLGSIHFVIFFSLAVIGRNIRQICQILLISWSFGKTQMTAENGDLLPEFFKNLF